MVIFFLGTAAAGCAFQTDEMRIHLDDENRGSFAAIGSSERLLVPANELEKSSEFKLATKTQQQLAACGFRSSVYTKDGKVYVSARMNFQYPHELTSTLVCAPTALSDVQVSVDKREGLLWDTYRTTIILHEPRLNVTVTRSKDGKKGDKNITLGMNNLQEVPILLRVAVPGEVTAIHNYSVVLGGVVRTRKADTANVLINLDFDRTADSRGQKVRTKFLERRVAMLERDKVDIDELEDQGVDGFSVEILSIRRNFRLQDILSLLGILFGSGMAVGLAKLAVGRWRGLGPPQGSVQV
jgi:hypothetical protein